MLDYIHHEKKITRRFAGAVHLVRVHMDGKGLATIQQSSGYYVPLVANCFLGAFPPVDLRAVCFVLAIVQ